MGVCSKAASPWASPLHMTPKKDSTRRSCGDYRRLNLITEPDHYAMPNISDLTSSIGTSRVFSKLDLLKGYFQVPVNPEDAPKTAITTPFGTYMFYYSTFGLRNLSENDGPDIRPSSLLQSLHRRHPGSIRKPQRASRTPPVCTRTTTQKRPRFQKRHMCLWSINCRVSWPRHQWRWHPTPSIQGRRSQQIHKTNYSQTTTRIPGDDQLLGYHRFIPNAARILTPLYHLSSAKQKQLGELNQTNEHAFTSAKDSLAQAAMLATPNSADNLFLVTDASNIAIGAVLEQGTDGHRRPLGFFSRKLNTPQQKYSTFDRELLAVHSAIRHSRHMLEGTSLL